MKNRGVQYVEADTAPSRQSHGGRCLCGAVRYRVSGPLRGVINCYCTQCQRAHGTGAAYTQASNANLHVTKDGGLKWFRSSDGVRRGFCRTCGSNLFWYPVDGTHTSISAGTLTQPTHLPVIGHIYVAGLPSHVKLPDDGLPRFEATSAGKLDGGLST